MNSSTCFVLKPYFNALSEGWLNYQDILTYITIRSFYNPEDKYCHPSYQTIQKKLGMSKKFIARSIKRLQIAGLLECWKVGSSRVQHYYKFPQFEQLLKVPIAILEIEELTSNQKSMLLVLHEHSNSSLQCELTTSQLASKCSLSLNTINKLVKSLILKGYVTREVCEDKLKETLVKHLKLTDKINWPSQIHILSDLLKADIVQTPNANAVLDLVTEVMRIQKVFETPKL